MPFRNSGINGAVVLVLLLGLRVCLKNRKWAAARDFGCARGGTFRASPPWAVRNGPTKRTGKSAAAGQFPFFRQTLRGNPAARAPDSPVCSIQTESISPCPQPHWSILPVFHPELVALLGPDDCSVRKSPVYQKLQSESIKVGIQPNQLLHGELLCRPSDGFFHNAYVQTPIDPLRSN